MRRVSTLDYNSLVRPGAREYFALQRHACQKAKHGPHSLRRSSPEVASERALPWELWDLTRPLGPSDVRLELLKFDADEAQEVFWRSSAHLLAAALESPPPDVRGAF